MSKVYEALRQKDLEVSSSLGAYAPPENETPQSSEPFPADLGVSDRTLQAAFAASEDELGLYESLPQFRGSPNQPAKDSKASREFPHLRLAPNSNSRLVFQTDPHGLAAEQYRFLRRNLEQKFTSGGVLMVTSPAPRDGKTLSTVNLCSCLADSGRSTLLLEGDIRQPSIHNVLAPTNLNVGIEDVLAGTSAPEDVVCVVDDLSFHVAMVKTPPQDPSRLIAGDGMRNLLAWGRAHFDWVVVDCPPVLPAADVTAMVSLADAAILVVRARSTPRDLASKSIELLGNHLFGVVMNEATVESNAYYRYLSDYRPQTKSAGHPGSSKAGNSASRAKSPRSM
jgi:capsular exopolysaccharide synthesis family protein